MAHHEDEGRKKAQRIVQTVAFPAMQDLVARLNESGVFPHRFVAEEPQETDGTFVCIGVGRAVGAAGARLSSGPLVSFKVLAEVRVENESMLRLGVTCEAATGPSERKQLRCSNSLRPIALGDQSVKEHYEHELKQCYDKCVQFFTDMRGASR